MDFADISLVQFGNGIDSGKQIADTNLVPQNLVIYFEETFSNYIFYNLQFLPLTVYRQ